MKPERQTRVLLSRLKPGERGQVAVYLDPQNLGARRLALLGLVPGEFFSVERTLPEIIIRFGYTRVAINRKLAQQIMIIK